MMRHGAEKKNSKQWQRLGSRCDGKWHKPLALKENYCAAGKQELRRENTSPACTMSCMAGQGQRSK